MRKTVLPILTALFLALGLLSHVIDRAGTCQPLMCRLMQRYAPPAATGLPEAEYAPVTQMITAYLDEDMDTFQHTYTLDGATYVAFNEKEQTHMADVKGLFALCGRLTAFCMLLVVLGGLLAYKDSRFYRLMRNTLLTVLAVATLLVIAAVIDFDGLFILFHKLAFTNDLWLLDPNTDLLIRLMPLEFFISYAVLIGGAWVLGMGLLIGLTYLVQRYMPKE